MKISNVANAGSQNMSGNYLLFILFSLTLTACGSSSSDKANSNGQANAATDAGAPDTDANGNGANSEPGNGIAGSNISFIGTVNIEQNGLSASAGFQSVNQNITAQQIQSNFSPSSDVCQIFENADAAIPQTGLEGIALEPIGAGDVLTLTSPTGTFAELVRNDATGFIFYQIAGGGNLPDAVPSGTVIDIPGDVFPAFSNVAIPDVDLLTNVALSTGSTLTADSTVTWDASSGPGTYIYLSANSITVPDASDLNVDPNSIDTTNINGTSVGCTVLDDGTFSFPADIALQMGSDFMAENFSFSRHGFSFEQQGNALLSITVSNSN